MLRNGLYGLAVTAAAMLLSAASAHAQTPGSTIRSTGPLTRIFVSDDLGCAVNHALDDVGEFFGDTACGTLVASSDALYGPADIPAGDSATPRTAWTPESQQTSGAGTATNPYRVVTTVSGGGLRLVQTDTYVQGSEAYGTRVAITNTTDEPLDITLYRAGDCYLQDSDYGYGAVDEAAGSVACVAGTEPDSRIEQWAPLTPGSHYFEAFYDDVWAAIGAREPFDDACVCDSHIDNGAGLSWTTTLAEGATATYSHLTAFSPQGVTEVSDSDGDGFPDQWEQPDGGVDTNGDGTPDLKLSDYGATPGKKDVFVQVGWRTTRSCVLRFFCSTRNRRPSLAALADVQRAFSQRGDIRLHVDAGADSLMNPDTGAKWGTRSAVTHGLEAPSRIPGASTNDDFDWGQAFDGYRRQLLPAARSRLFHFMLYVGTFNERGNSGLSRSTSDADFPGRDMMLAYDSGAFPSSGPRRAEEAGTFMHELGHNLGLSHGGSLEDGATNAKPNYPSVMNYAWQLSLVPKNSSLGDLDYSEGTLDPIDESALSETGGLGPDGPASDIGTSWACPNRTVHPVAPSVFDVDWNCNGHIDGGTVAVNVNNPSYLGYNDPALSVLRDHDDWGSLIFDGGGAIGGAGDPNAAVPLTPIAQEPDPAVLAATAAHIKSVTFTGPGQLSIQAGTSAPVTMVVSNPHEQTRSYGLSVVARGVMLTGLPSSVTLAPHASRRIVATLRAGGSNDAAFFEVDATSNELTDSDSAVTEVFVVGRAVPDQPGTARPPATPAADTRAPTQSIRVAKRQRLARLAIRMRLDEAGMIKVRATTRLRKGARKRFRTVTRHVAPNRFVKVRLKLSRRTARQVKRALRRGSGSRVIVTIAASDLAGNRSVTRRRILLIR